METLGERIKRLREAANVSQSQLAAYLDINQSMVARIEKNERSLSTDLVDKLADFFCVQAYDLLYEEKIEPELRVAFRASAIGEDDFRAIAEFNRIILNHKQMSVMSEGKIKNEI